MNESDRPNPLRWRNEAPMDGIFLNPGDQDGLSLLDLPVGLQPKRPPALAAGAVASAEVKAFVERILESLHNVRAADAAIVLDCSRLAVADRRMLADILGEGEVCIVAGGEGVTQVVESTLTGVWQVLGSGEDGATVVDRIEIGAVPRIVREIALAGAAQPAPLPDPLPEGVMNAPPVIAEAAARAREWQPGVDNHVINFTLLPMNAADAGLIAHCLGQAPLLILSQGYGAARVLSTAVRHIWAVQYMNSTGKIILDTLEIGDVPQAALAAAEDFEDSAKRLAEIIAAYLV